MRAVRHLCEFYSGMYLTSEETAQINPSQGSRRVTVYILHITIFMVFMIIFTLFLPLAYDLVNIRFLLLPEHCLICVPTARQGFLF